MWDKVALLNEYVSNLENRLVTPEEMGKINAEISEIESMAILERLSE
jgi:DNA-binding TFAR19-related protein (PDSD5 family)